MSRSYSSVRPKVDRVYSVADVQELYQVCRNTVSNWVRAGLHPSDEKTPQVFRGAELIRFHKSRRLKDSIRLSEGQFKCMRCKIAVYPDPTTISIDARHAPRCWVLATCPDCGGQIQKITNVTECDKIRSCIDTNMGLRQTHEANAPPRAGIGKIKAKAAKPIYTANDRLIQEWQIYAKRHDEKTIDAHLRAIRRFEASMKGGRFDRITPYACNAFREELLKLGRLNKDAGGLSRSTIQHIASHLGAFVSWLVEQDGYRRLKPTLHSYFDLPRGKVSRSLAEEARPYPTLAQAAKMVDGMPTVTPRQIRDRAMVATAFVCGFRANALASLRIKHVDLTRKCIVHDAREIRAKNGKSYRAHWFPRTEPMQDVLQAWVEELAEAGFGPDDALFPPDKYLTRTPHVAPGQRNHVPTLRSISAVTEAFRVASEVVGIAFTPHSARHTLAALGRHLCRTARARKAWSDNLGHESEITTDRYYGKLTDQEREEEVCALRETGALTDDEKDRLLEYYEHKLPLDSDDFKQAEELSNRRRGLIKARRKQT